MERFSEGKGVALKKCHGQSELKEGLVSQAMLHNGTTEWVAKEGKKCQNCYVKRVTLHQHEIVGSQKDKKSQKEVVKKVEKKDQIG